MPNFYVTEYAKKATDERGNPVEAGEEPAIAIQKVSFTGTAGVSAAFNRRTTFVRVYHDYTDFAHMLVGEAPTATNSHTPVAQDSAEYFGVDRNRTLKVSFIQTS